MASVGVLQSFKAQIDITKLIKLIKDETKTTKIMKNPEINALALGQLMCLSALIESEAYKTGQLVNSDTITSLASSLIYLYQTYDFLRESIQTAFAKLLQNLPEAGQGIKLLEKIVAELLIANKKQGGDIKDYIFEHSDNLSLYLSLRHIYISPKYKDQTTKIAKHLTMDIFDDDQSLHKLKTIAGKSVYIYPRLHTSLPLLINEIYIKHASSSKLRLQLIKKLATVFFEDHFFNEQVYQAIKSSATRPKFLHIGLKFWELLGL